MFKPFGALLASAIWNVNPPKNLGAIQNYQKIMAEAAKGDGAAKNSTDYLREKHLEFVKNLLFHSEGTPEWFLTEHLRMQAM